MHKQKLILCALKKYPDVYSNKLSAQRIYREAEILSQLQQSPDIIGLYEMVECINKDSIDIYFVMKYMDCDLQRALSCGLLQKIHKENIFAQILKGVFFLHSKHCMHRDIKPSNILLNKDCNVKIGDFGLVRSIPFSDYASFDDFDFTDYVSSRWYRAPEVLLGSSRYTEKIDMWAVGCVLGEIILGRPLFEGSSSLDQLQKIFTYIDRPSENDLIEMDSKLAPTILNSLKKTHKKHLENLFPEQSEEFLDLLNILLVINPNKRCSAEDALKHPFVAKMIVND